MNTPQKLPLPLPAETYSQLPLSLKLLAWHCKPKDEAAFVAYLQGKHSKVSTLATMLWFQDYTGVPEINNFFAKRKALQRMGLDPTVITAKVDTHLVFDHSVRTLGTLQANLADELRLNYGRIRLAKSGGKCFGIKIIPPNKGVIHQINFEKMVPVFDKNGRPIFGKGTDSHSPMVNGLCVLAWGIGGSEAQDVIAGAHIDMKIPRVFALKLTGKLRPGISTSDLALYLKKILRGVRVSATDTVGVTGSFIDVIGNGVDSLPVPARGTLSNVAAEFGSRTVMFGIDKQTVDFLSLSDRDAGVEELAKAYMLWRNEETESLAKYTMTIEVDLADVERGINGPVKPHLWTPLGKAQTFVSGVLVGAGLDDEKSYSIEGVEEPVPEGALLLASIASCTHTSNPDSVIRAALFMKKAAEKGLRVKSWVKTAFASGSLLAGKYLEALNLLPAIKAMGFEISAHGCGACIGQSGGLNAIGEEFLKKGGKGTSIVSSNRNYEGRQDPKISISFLGAPDLVVAYALAGRMDVDIETYDFGGGVTLADLSSTEEEVAAALTVISKEMHTEAYQNLFVGSPEYEAIEAPDGPVYDWPEGDVLVKEPPFFASITAEPPPINPLKKARMLGIFGDGFSTDAISPAGEPIQIPAVMSYLRSQEVTNLTDVLSLGGYRSNDQIVAAMTYSNPTNRNNIDGVTKQGGWTIHHPTGKELSIYEASKLYRDESTPLVVLAGKNYGCGSSRVMAATGPGMLGVEAIIAESFEAIHRSNLWQNGIVPLCYPEGTTAESLGIKGAEMWDIPLDSITPETKTLAATLHYTDGTTKEVLLSVMLDTEQELNFLRHGGLMQMQIREFAKQIKKVA